MTASLLLGFSALAQTTISFQTGRIDITPPESLPLGGYTERRGAKFVSGGDALDARTLVFNLKSTRIAVVSVEMLTVPESLRREVQARIPQGVNLFLSATHTHCAPDSQMLNDRMTIPLPGIARFDATWLAWYADRIAFGVNSTLKSPATAGSHLTYRMARVALNRSRRKDGTPDPAAFRLEANGTSLVTHFAAHPVFYGPGELQLRGDWPGRVAGNGLALQGAIGDISPASPDGESPKARIEAFARQLEGGLRKSTSVDLSAKQVKFVEVPIELGNPTPHPEFAKRYGVQQAFAQTLIGSFAPPSAKITAFRIGKLAVVGVPGEPTGALGLRIRNLGRAKGFDVCLVTSHVNGWIGYILEPADYDRGGYEATLSLHGRETGERVFEAAKKAIDELSRAAKRDN